jgi:hypothetical protein
MSIFSSILNKIFPHDHPANTGSGAAAGAIVGVQRRGHPRLFARD